MNRLRTIQSTVVLLGICNPSVLAGGAEIARFQREYPAASLRLDERYSRLKGTCTITYTLPRGRGYIDRCTFACDGDARKVEIRRHGKAGGPLLGEFVHCLGETSSFQLMRMPGKDYRVEGLGGDPTDRDAYSFLFGRFLAAPLLDFEWSLRKRMSLPMFRVSSANYVEHRGRTLMQVECEVGDPASATKWRLLMDPEADWVIHRSEVQLGRYPGAAEVYEVEYGSRDQNPPLPKVVKLKMLNGADATCIFENITSEPTPDSEFTMSAYGLADLAGSATRRPRSHFSYWAGGVAVTGLLFAFLLRALAKRGVVRS